MTHRTTCFSPSANSRYAGSRRLHSSGVNCASRDPPPPAPLIRYHFVAGAVSDGSGSLEEGVSSDDGLALFDGLEEGVPFDGLADLPGFGDGSGPFGGGAASFPEGTGAVSV
ncbi:hypothetical protein, partial [Streptomyces sp. NPDC093109]|uniref:hypothetical protein n=1 Tax=Streptomyces sp. NPDC093109 TaxID=3154977 RepID=UPI00344E6CF3